jgi:hypothetical protein
MSSHELFVGVSALALALAAKMAKRWYSGVALVSPLGCRRKGFPIANGGFDPGTCRAEPERAMMPTRPTTQQCKYISYMYHKYPFFYLATTILL